MYKITKIAKSKLINANRKANIRLIYTYSFEVFDL